jgi:hypothetical protein
MDFLHRQSQRQSELDDDKEEDTSDSDDDDKDEKIQDLGAMKRIYESKGNTVII